jgi:TonB family protein
MKPQVFIVTTTKAGRSRKFIWDTTDAVEVDMPRGWTLEKVNNSIHVRQGSQVIPVSAAALEKGSAVTLPAGKGSKDISLKIQPINQIRAAYLNDPVYKRDPVREMQLFASFGVGKYLVDYQPFRDAYVGYVRKKPVFTFVRSPNGSQIKALLDEMRIKFKGQAPQDLELAKPLMVTDDQLLDAMIMRGNHWWRIHQVAMPKALTPEQIKVSEYDPEANSFKRLLKGVGILLLLLLFLILIIPKSEEEKKEEPKPEPVKIKLKQAKFQRAIPRGEPEQEVGIRAPGDAQDKPKLSAPKSEDKEALEAAAKKSAEKAEKDKNMKAERAEKEKELREMREKQNQEKAADRAKQKEEQQKVAQEKAAERQRMNEERQKAAQEAAAERQRVAQERAAEKQRQREEAAERAAQEKAARANAAAQAQLNQFRGAFGGIAGKKVSGDPGGGSAGAEAGIYAGGGANSAGGGSSALGGGSLNVGPGRLGGRSAKVGLSGGNGTGEGSPRGSGSSGVSYGSGDKGIANGKGGAFVPVDPGGIKADTGLTKNEIGEVIYRKRSEVRYCYEAALIRKTGLEGKVVVQFTIMASGLVKSAAVEDSTVDDQILEQCIINHLKRWKFPKTRGGVEVGVSYPFVFKILGKE